MRGRRRNDRGRRPEVDVGAGTCSPAAMAQEDAATHRSLGRNETARHSSPRYRDLLHPVAKPPSPTTRRRVHPFRQISTSRSSPCSLPHPLYGTRALPLTLTSARLHLPGRNRAVVCVTSPTIPHRAHLRASGPSSSDPHRACLRAPRPRADIAAISSDRDRHDLAHACIKFSLPDTTASQSYLMDSSMLLQISCLTASMLILRGQGQNQI